MQPRPRPVGAARAAGHLPPIIGFGVLAVLLTWPFARDVWRGRVDGDATQFVWDAWWVKERLVALENPWHTDALFAPEGTYLAAHPLETLLMALVSPLTALAGPTATYGALVLGTLTAAGLLARLLGLALGLGEIGSAVTGLVWLSAPVVLHRTTTGLFMLLLLAALLPGVVLLAHRLVRGPTRGRALALGAFLGACLLTDLQVTTYLLLAVAAVGVHAAVTGPAWRSRAAARLAGLVVGSMLVVGLPALVAVGLSERHGDYRTPTAARVASATAYNADLAQLVLPSPASRFFGDAYRSAARRLGDLSAFTVDSAVALGWATLALAVGGVVMTHRSRRTWWLVAAVALAAVLSLGPNPKAFGRIHVPLAVDVGEEVSLLAPATWLLGVPILNDLRIPARYMQLGALPLALLAGLGAQALVRRRRILGPAAVVGLCGLAVAEGAVTVPAKGPPGEKLARLVRDDPRPGIVVDVPLSWRSGIEEIGSYEVSPRAMLQQTTHEKPIAAGYIARLDRTMLERLLMRPLYRSLLLRQRNGEIPDGLEDPARADVLADLRELAARWVVVWPEADRGVLPYLGELGYRLTATDGDVLLYSR